MTIDLTSVDTEETFHLAMKSQPGFPDWYGGSWDAFWDAIMAVVEMSDCVVLQHWDDFAQAYPHDTQILREIMADYPKKTPDRQLLLAS